jgi:hypothetical protein
VRSRTIGIGLGRERRGRQDENGGKREAAHVEIHKEYTLIE